MFGEKRRIKSNRDEEIDSMVREVLKSKPKGKVRVEVQTKHSRKNSKKWYSDYDFLPFDPSIHNADVILYEIQTKKYGHITEFSWVPATVDYSQAVKKPWWYLVKVKIKYANPK